MATRENGEADLQVLRTICIALRKVRAYPLKILKDI